MGATKIEFRLRMAIMVAMVSLGFWAPWIEAWGIGRRTSLLGWLALGLVRLGLGSFAVAAPAAIAAAALIAAAGVALRVWGTAYLGPFTVNHGQMKAGAVLAEGPYRHVRNPLYLGSWLVFAAMAFLMPVSGALIAMVLLTGFLLRLILGEEAFLAGQLGETYRSYLRAAPRLLPRFGGGAASANLELPGLEAVARQPQWLRAVLSELFPIGVFLTLAFLSWSYDNWLMTRGVIVSLGVSLVVRALLPASRQESGLRRRT
jgi:protein-S-isoprenylcysteine O-methyltransferase Ste14